jgi:hypothetical protein
VHQAIWSNTGDSFLVITAANQPQIYDRDGAQIAEYMKGDMYIRDMRHCACVGLILPSLILELLAIKAHIPLLSAK